MATVNKNFRIKDGLIVEGTTGTINGEDILTTGSNTDSLPEGSTNQYFTNARVENAMIDPLTLGTQTNISVTYNTGTGAYDFVAENGGIQTGSDASFNTVELTSNGAGVNIKVGDDAYIGDVNLGDTINIQGIENDTTGFVSFGQNGSLIDNTGKKLNYIGFDGSDLNIVSSGDIILNADGTAYLGSVTAGNAVATQSDISAAISTAAGNYDAAGSASGVQSNLDDHISDTSAHGVTGDIVGTTDAQSLSNKTFQGQVNFQSGGGAGGTNNHINVDNSTGKMTVESGYSLDLKSDGTVSIISNGSDIVLNADGDSYLGSVASGNQIATQSDIDTAVNGLAPNYITSTTSEFSVTDGQLSLDSLSGQTQVNPASGAQPDNGYGTIEYVDTDAGNERLKISAEHGWTGGNVGGNLELHAYNNINLNTNNGDIVLNPDGNSYLGSVASANAIATRGYVDGLAGNYDAAGAASQALTDANGYTDTAVANLVDSAPELLNTLNELAAAIADNPNYATDMATSLSNKQNTLTASTGITIDGSNNISVTANTYDAYGAADTAESNANSYTDSAISGLSTVYDAYGAASTAESNANSYTDTAINNLDLTANFDAAGSAAQALVDANSYTDGYVGSVLAGNEAFTAVDINSVAKQVAAITNVPTAGAAVAYAFAKADYRAAEFLVKVNYGIHTEVSKVILTLDTSDNIAITEYAVVGTNGSLSTITAGINGGNVELQLTTTHNSSTVVVSGTLLV